MTGGNKHSRRGLIKRVAVSAAAVTGADLLMRSKRSSPKGIPYWHLLERVSSLV
ncbi:hypothetical protein [Rivularia sp. UHCC 0363]|uniref:hypothetical protein n=1 Tax=Rivularia sp. UHCC 0363 TaxID=3110244 RepID=UPI002B1F63C2|nr:hypothetical protein [Rivularia sp. UHCC 0363]MEA5597419.1 hypothetical protein [Rivularia sp. UHCC 0363]